MSSRQGYNDRGQFEVHDPDLSESKDQLIANASEKEWGYRILSELGTGGTAVVYKAMDTILDKVVAELRNLELLDVTGDELLTDSDLKTIINANKKLKYLWLDGCRNVTWRTLKLLPNSCVEDLSFCGHELGTEGVNALVACKTLKWLCLI